jgi:hypothetical protein
MQEDTVLYKICKEGNHTYLYCQNKETFNIFILLQL